VFEGTEVRRCQVAMADSASQPHLPKTSLSTEGRLKLLNVLDIKRRADFLTASSLNIVAIDTPLNFPSIRTGANVTISVDPIRCLLYEPPIRPNRCQGFVADSPAVANIQALCTNLHARSLLQRKPEQFLTSHEFALAPLLPGPETRAAKVESEASMYRQGNSSCEFRACRYHHCPWSSIPPTV